MFQSNGIIKYEFDWDDKMVYLNYGRDFAIDKNSKIADRSNSAANEYFKYYDQYVKTTFLKDINYPYMIVDAEGAFTNLDNIFFDNLLINQCNNQGLDIYLWEIPIIGLHKDPGIKFTSSADIVYDFDKADSVLHGYDNNQSCICYEFEKIKTFIKQNELTNVTVNTGLYNQNKYFDFDFRLKTRDLYLSAIVTPSTDNTIKTFTHNSEIKPSSKEHINHKFINLNKRYEGFRQIVAAHLVDKDCVLSYIHKHTDLYYKSQSSVKMLKDVNWYWNNINYRVPFNVDDLYNHFTKLQSNINYLEQQKVLTVDKTLNDSDWLELDNDEEFDVPTDFYHKAFCAVVNESTFAFPVAHFADKTINAVKCYRPFVLVAPPHTLEYMQVLGFKTFENFWNEDYDKEENHLQRLKSVLKLINELDKMSIDECREMYEQMLPILKHNYNLLKTVRHQKGI